VNLGPGGSAIGEHCLVRGFNEGMKSSLTSSNVRVVLNQTTFESFRTTLENGGRGVVGMGLHGGGHAVVGGELLDPFSSPGDPLFYLHHGNLDRIWWRWQMADPTNRLYALSGPTTQTPPFTNITLDFKMPFTSIAAPLAVREVMDIESEPSCFQYA
jgi:tyrosinase